MRTLANAALLCGAFLTSLSFGASLPDPSETQIQDIITKFAAKEAEFSRARGNGDAFALPLGAHAGEPRLEPGLGC